ncbi:MAG TPA: indolepyruvate oxidoreductase subunit beta family protein [Woeseiaceae bacterium]
MTARLPTSILLCALGGEGGASITRWIAQAAELEAYFVQTTSIPGVAQRTGATTYYIEMMPSRDCRTPPVMALAPTPGAVDYVLATELVEVARALQSGYISPDRTMLVASSHRVYTVAEKGAMGDGRLDTVPLEQAIEKLARRAVLFDMSALAASHRVPVTMVLLGAAARFLPLSREALETVVARALPGEASLRAFAAGWDAAVPDPAGTRAWPDAPGAADARIASFNLKDFPAAAQPILQRGLARLLDYQDAEYAELYLERVRPIAALDRRLGGEHDGFRLTVETARHAALWMSYEDVIRVADLKTRRDRLEQVSREAGAGENQPIRIIEYLKPGVEELCSILPGWLASPILAFCRRRGLTQRLNVGLRISSNEFPGFLVFRALAALRRFRRRMSRFQEEQRAIENWLAAVQAASARDRELGCAIAECAGLVKGYGETRQRGAASFERILKFYQLGHRAGWDSLQLGRVVRAARAAALEDAEGASLARVLDEGRALFGQARTARPGEPTLEEKTA